MTTVVASKELHRYQMRQVLRLMQMNSTPEERMQLIEALCDSFDMQVDQVAYGVAPPSSAPAIVPKPFLKKKRIRRTAEQIHDTVVCVALQNPGLCGSDLITAARLDPGRGYALLTALVAAGRLRVEKGVFKHRYFANPEGVIRFPSVAS